MTVVTVGNYGETLQYLFPFVINTTLPNFHSCTYFDMKFTIQQNVLCLQILMQEGRVHIVKEIDPQGNLIQNPQSQRPGERRVQVLLWTCKIVQVLMTHVITPGEAVLGWLWTTDQCRARAQSKAGTNFTTSRQKWEFPQTVLIGFTHGFTSLSLSLCQNFVRHKRTVPVSLLLDFLPAGKPVQKEKNKQTKKNCSVEKRELRHVSDVQYMLLS